ncbi:unnamed protein product, partial [Mesorhabditis belari]|uniref:Nbr1 FW domain-containing protein n=1 Tax=Mesorhabditis belari TaxID=2138241 RepID=A0AAF3J336_9BILA
METDEVDNILSQQMSCMVTNDKEALVREFQKIIGDHSLTPETCAFFLDMSNWNLQSALGAFYDYGISNNAHLLAETNISLMSMGLVKDVTIGEGESVPPNTRFTKTWRVRNTGSVIWPPGSLICFMEGQRMTPCEVVDVPCVVPGGEADVSVEMVSPSDPGIYQSRWQLNSPQRVPIGESIWCIISVDAFGILDITQQLASAPLNDNNPRPFSNFGDIGPIPFTDTRQSFNPFNNESTRSSVNRDSTMQEDTSQSPVAELTSPFELTAQLQRVLVSQPVTILRREGTEGPPCTPCTPPHHPDHNTWSGQERH